VVSKIRTWSISISRSVSWSFPATKNLPGP